MTHGTLSSEGHRKTINQIIRNHHIEDNNVANLSFYERQLMLMKYLTVSRTKRKDIKCNRSKAFIRCHSHCHAQTPRHPGFGDPPP